MCGVNVNEALEAECLIIATDAVGSSYDLLDGKCGLRIENKNIEATISVLENIETSEEVRICCQNKAKQ